MTVNGAAVYIGPDGKPVAGAGGRLSGEATKEKNAASPDSSDRVEHAGVTGGLSVQNRGAIRHYTGAGYRAVNGHLVGKTAASPETQDTITHLDEALSRASLSEPKTVFRGMGSLAVKSFMEQTGGKPRKGQVVEFAGFTSTSEDAYVARSFAQQSSSGIIAEIKLPKGASAIDVSKYSDTGASEKEILVARGASFKVVGFDLKSKKLTLEMVMAKQDKKPKPAQDAAVNAEAKPVTENRFAWENGDGLSVTGEGEGPVLFTLRDLGIEEGA